MKYMILAILFCSFSFICMASFPILSDTIYLQKESIDDYNLRIKNQGFGNEEKILQMKIHISLIHLQDQLLYYWE